MWTLSSNLTWNQYTNNRWKALCSEDQIHITWKNSRKYYFSWKNVCVCNGRGRLTVWIFQKSSEDVLCLSHFCMQRKCGGLSLRRCDGQTTGLNDVSWIILDLYFNWYLVSWIGIFNSDLLQFQNRTPFEASIFRGIYRHIVSEELSEKKKHVISACGNIGDI